MPPPTLIETAVDRLRQSSNLMQGMFDANYTDENKRSQIKSSAAGYINTINQQLKQLMGERGLIKGALSSPQSAFNFFVATWNSGQGDLVRSKNAVDEYVRLLSNAKAEIDEAIRKLREEKGAGPGGAGPPLTQRDLELCAQIATDTHKLLIAFAACVTRHNAAQETEIKELVTTIMPLMYQLARSPAAPGALKSPIALWKEFSEKYQQGRGINQPSLEVLQGFNEALNQARAKGAGAH